MGIWSRGGRLVPAGIAGAVLYALFRLNWFSAGWNILIGLIVTAVLFILSGMIGYNDESSS